jgi:uncharacterized protein YqjF (DUF2071 family)
MFAQVAHRPYPLPARPWIMGMRWHDLLFMHWPVPREALRPLIPAALKLDAFDGQCWIGVVPFRMSGVRARWTPPLPWLSAFLELNVRTYVTADGKPGVWFFSLDAANPVAVRGARWSYHLPYFDARMTLTRDGDWIDYTSRRTHRGAAEAQFAARYRPTGPEYLSRPGTLEHWLTERYCLYAAKDDRHVYRGEIHHAQWPLRSAEADVRVNGMTDWLGITLPDCPPLLHFAGYLDVVGWWPERISLATGP